MDLETIWRENSGTDHDLARLLDEGNFNRLHSRLPLKRLKNNLLIGIIWALVITAGYIVLFFWFHIWQVCLALGVLTVFNVLIMVDSWKLYNKTPGAVKPSNSLREELQVHYNSFQRWWSVQQKISLFVYPIAVSGGFILGGVVGSGKPVAAFLYDSKMLGIWAITLLVMVPLCYFGARWMFNYAYGRHLKKLKSAIDELS